METQEQAVPTPPKRGRFSWRRFVQTMLTLALAITCLVVMMSASRHQGKRFLSTLDIRVENKAQAAFMDEARVKSLASHNGRIDLMRTPLAGLDLRGMEAALAANPWLESARVYVDNEYALHIQVKQRLAAIRIFQNDGESYYLDRALEKLPLSSDYTAYVPVVTNVPPLGNDSLGAARRQEIGWMVRYIAAQPFWRAQASQIAMADNGTEYELVPVVGKQRILLGDTSRMEEKLTNLMAFYKQVQNRIGWDKYHTIDVRFAGQIVAAPALKWKMPVDHATANINWVDAIMAETANDPALTPAAPRPQTSAPRATAPKPNTHSNTTNATPRNNQPKPKPRTAPAAARATTAPAAATQPQPAAPRPATPAQNP